jgi:hypothetical protein
MNRTFRDDKGPLLADEMACTAGDDDGTPLTRAESAMLLIAAAAFAGAGIAVLAFFVGWLVS